MASSSFYAFSCFFLLTSPLIFLSGVDSSANTQSFIEDTCLKVTDEDTKKICSDYLSGVLDSELPDTVKVDHHNFTEGFMFGATTAGYEMMTKLGLSMVAMANEKQEISPEMQQCINSYESATNATLAAYYSFRKKDYKKASSQMLQASTVVGVCEKPLEKQSDLLESHRMFVDMTNLPIKLIDGMKSSTKGSS